jgi:hypothetical protein
MIAVFCAFSQFVELLCRPCSNFLLFWHRANQGKEGGKMRENRIEERGRRQNNFLQGIYHKDRSVL